VEFTGGESGDMTKCGKITLTERQELGKEKRLADGHMWV
jgi:hypothetical protein